MLESAGIRGTQGRAFVRSERTEGAKEVAGKTGSVVRGGVRGGRDTLILR
jgi:hypothetical protein